MTIAFDILTGIGLAAACGVRPFLPALVFGALAYAHTGVDLRGTELAFLTRPWFLLVLTVLFVASVLGHGYAAREPAASALLGVGIGIGGLLFAGALAQDGYTWWPGVVAGAAITFFAQYSIADVLTGARARLAAEHRGGLPIYLEVVAGIAAALAIFIPPISLLYIGFLTRLLLARRRRASEKYAGLRTLR